MAFKVAAFLACVLLHLAAARYLEDEPEEFNLRDYLRGAYSS